MQKQSLVLVILFVISGLFYYYMTEPVITREEVTVTNIVDGDTVDLGSGVRVRLKGINTPEKGKPYFEQAKDFLQNQVLNKTIELESFEIDKYGRTLGYIFFNNQNINEKILEEGLANLYYYGKDEHYNDLAAAEEFARKNQRGIWKKSPNEACLELIQLKFKEEPKRCTNDELLKIKNRCDEDLQVIIKDDATHMYEETINANSVFVKQFSCIFNNAGDSLYVSDDEGLLLFYRY